MPETPSKNLIPRPPIVVVMGHVDHGKTSLLDYIRKANVVSKEAGGITQSIGAYEISHTLTGSGRVRKITFIDTPGHEAFKAMRSRGATVADIAILVVAGDEGVKPQTIEAINTLKEVETPYIVAITKIDRPNANIEKVKSELLSNEVLLEGLGGDVSWQGVSAVTGEGVGELIDLILLLGDVLDLKYNPDSVAEGVVIEATKDSRRGVVASLVLRNGALRTGEYIATESTYGKIKLLEDFKGERISELYPSAPARVIGFEDLPAVGEKFQAGDVDLAEIKLVPIGNVSIETDKTKAPLPEIQEDKESIKIITKADTSGSLEALNHVIREIEKVRIIGSGVGDITDGDVDQAISMGSAIAGFRVKTVGTAASRAETRHISIFSSNIIYRIVEEIEKHLKQIKGETVVGELEVLKVFSTEGKRVVFGGKVVSGSIKIGSETKIERRGTIISSARIINMQENRKDVVEVAEGKECGLLAETDAKILPGDRLKVFGE
ncbi:MAG: translation initiation factor IF-2 [Patescibacteria group bacterium]|nr:translation initiation factor IF-2 [Patescibacteria group bacterium]